MGTSSEKIAATARVVVRAVDEEATADLLLRMAELASRDDGTEIWAYHRGPRGSHEFFTYELFRDKAALALHQANEELSQMGKELEEMAVDLSLVAGRLSGGFHPFRLIGPA